MSGIEVRKYGGSSLENRNKILSIVNDIKKCIQKDSIKRLIVVSAMGDTTDRLESIFNDYCDEKDFQEKALLLSTGELQSSALISTAFKNIGLRSKVLLPFNIPIKTQGHFLNSNIKYINGNFINGSFKENDVIIIPGFQGIDDFGNITLLGRGGSDTSAISLSASLGIESCNIYSDVCGVYNSDPAVIENSTLFKNIDYDFMGIMSKNGAGVMHYKAVELAKKHNIIINCCHSFKSGIGTKITKYDMSKDSIALVHDNKIVRMIISDSENIKVVEKIFKKLDNGYDVYTINKNKKAFVFSENLFLEILNNIKKDYSDTIYKDLSYDLDVVKISIIGKNLKDLNVKKRIDHLLKIENIGYDHIFQDDLRISLIVSSENYKQTMKKIYATLI